MWAKGQRLQQEWLCHRKVHLCSLPATWKDEDDQKWDEFGIVHSFNKWIQWRTIKRNYNCKKLLSWAKLVANGALTHKSENSIYDHSSTEFEQSCAIYLCPTSLRLACNPICHVLHRIIGLSEPHVTKPVGGEDKLWTWTQQQQQHQSLVRRAIQCRPVPPGKEFKMRLLLSFALLMLLADQLEAGR